MNNHAPFEKLDQAYKTRPIGPCAMGLVFLPLILSDQEARAILDMTAKLFVTKDQATELFNLQHRLHAWEGWYLLASIICMSFVVAGTLMWEQHKIRQRIKKLSRKFESRIRALESQTSQEKPDAMGIR